MAYEFMHATAPKFSDGSGYQEHPVDMLNRLSQEGWDLVQSFSLESHLMRRDARLSEQSIAERVRMAQKPQSWSPGQHVDYDTGPLF